MKRFLSTAVTSIGLVLLLAFATTEGIARPHEKRVKAADTILKNGQIYTVDAAQSWANAVAVRNGKIAYVGTNDGVAAFEGGDTRVIDLRGRMVVPGFIDGHNHVSDAPEGLFWLNSRPFTNNVAQLGQALVEYRANDPGMKQLRAIGWSPTAVADASAATGLSAAQLLDQYVPDIPVLVLDNAHHTLWINSTALRNAGIDENTPNPPGAAFDRVPGTPGFGVPNGVVREFGAMSLIEKALPEPEFTVEQFRAGILLWQDLAVVRGVTSVLVPQPRPTENFYEAFQQLDDEGRLTARYDVAIWANEVRGVEQIQEMIAIRRKYKDKGHFFNRKSNDEGKFLEIGKTIKIFGTDNASRLIWDQDVLNQTVNALDKEGFRVYVHVISNADVNNAILDAFEYNLNHGGRRELRHTITHVGNGAVPTVSRFFALGVRADGHPVPKAFFDEGVASSSSSDFPVRDFFPQSRIQTGVLNDVALGTMIASHTINGAELIFAEKETGSIEVGKAADLVVFDKNLFDLSPAEITTANVVMTMFAGKDIYRDASFMSASHISLLAARLAEEGQIDRTALRPLLAHLQAVGHFENKQDRRQVIRHTEGFLRVLDHARPSIESAAYDLLKANAESLIAVWR